ncbi:hypothetical protein PR048_017939 [Dryococelus australis]|uniref:Uncharacterized protein n=1 Tax=Dryococelus australis TaxID=614101 RepID=A0ABQ9HAV1_9NEOP|nr:hypothetical protein PR048_017939 [Dryococelus australis]
MEWAGSSHCLANPLPRLNALGFLPLGPLYYTPLNTREELEARIRAAFEAVKKTPAIFSDVLFRIPATISDSGRWAASLLASHQGEQSSIPGRVTPAFSHVGIVPDDAAGRWVFWGISRFPCPFIPALFHTHLLSPSSALKTSVRVRSFASAITHGRGIQPLVVRALQGTKVPSEITAVAPSNCTSNFMLDGCFADGCLVPTMIADSGVNSLRRPYRSLVFLTLDERVPTRVHPTLKQRTIISRGGAGYNAVVRGQHLWDELNRRLRARQARPKSIAQLLEWLQEEWRQISVDVLQTLVESMPDRVAAVIAARAKSECKDREIIDPRENSPTRLSSGTIPKCIIPGVTLSGIEP